MGTHRCSISVHCLRSYVVVLLNAFWFNERVMKWNFQYVLLFVAFVVLTKILVDKIKYHRWMNDAGTLVKCTDKEILKYSEGSFLQCLLQITNPPWADLGSNPRCPQWSAEPYPGHGVSIMVNNNNNNEWMKYVSCGSKRQHKWSQ